MTANVPARQQIQAAGLHEDKNVSDKIRYLLSTKCRANED